MKKELDNYLCSKYPTLFRDRHANPKQTAMCWGFAVGDGWFTLIDVMSELISAHSADIVAAQVKEKFGTLRFYHDGGDRYTAGVEMAGEVLSKRVCEVCGMQALIQNNDSHWSGTLCNQHANEHSDKFEFKPDFARVAVLGLGKAWSTLVILLLELCDFNIDHNGMHETLLSVEKENDRLVITHTGGNDFAAGMIDFFMTYANRIDEHDGRFIKLH